MVKYESLISSLKTIVAEGSALQKTVVDTLESIWTTVYSGTIKGQVDCTIFHQVAAIVKQFLERGSSSPHPVALVFSLFLESRLADGRRVLYHGGPVGAVPVFKAALRRPIPVSIDVPDLVAVPVLYKTLVDTLEI